MLKEKKKNESAKEEMKRILEQDKRRRFGDDYVAKEDVKEKTP